MDIHHALRSRRTHKTYAGGPISRAQLTDIIEAATWAPNHRFTEPWHFYVVHGADRLAAMDAEVQAALSAAAKDAGEAAARKLESKKRKMTGRLGATAAVIVVTWQRSPDDAALDREDYAATACAIQNLMLSAHGHGFVSLWSSSKMLCGPALRQFYGVSAEETIAGVVFLGTPTGELDGRRHKSVETVTSWV
ncbi:MAG: nitroreductase [Myxococcales bacterium]|nr:nitroreductase [Myxococcales bacterium]